MTLRYVEWQRLSVISLCWFVLIVLAYLYLDQPVARFAHYHLRDPFILRIGGPSVYETFTDIAAAVEPVSLWGLALIGVAALLGRPSTSWARLFIAAALAAIVADVAKNELKYAFGRTWPETWLNGNPSLIRDGVFGFFPFHGGVGWSSFPSGHTTMITTPMAVLWFARPRLRWLAALLTLLVIVGLIGLDYHFFSDCMAGLWLGTIIGGAAANLFGLTGPQPASPQQG